MQKNNMKEMPMNNNVTVLRANDADEIQPISLADLWNTLYRRKIIIGICVLACLVLGFLFYTLSPREYQARAVVLLDNQQRDVQIKAVLTTEPNDLTMVPSEIQVLISRDLTGKVIDKLGIVQNPSLLTDDPVLNNSKSSTAALSKEDAAKRRENLTGQILSNLKVRQVEKSRAIEVSFEGKNPQIAADIVNTLTKLYIEQQLSSNFDAIRMTNDWMADRVAETQKKVFEADTKVAKYRAEAGIVDSRGIDLIEQNITELSNKLTTAKAELSAAEARLGAVQDKKKLESAPEVLNAPLIQNLRQREAESRDELAALQNQLGAEHPKVQTARAQVNEISGKIRQEISKLAQGQQAERDTALKNVENIEAQIATLKTDYNKYKSDNVELAALESEAATNRAFLETLSLRFRETQSQEDNKFQTPYARIISPAAVPDYPSSPKGKLIMAAALLVGLAFGGGLALALDMMQHGVYNGRQLQRITGKTNIAVVPKAALNPSKNIVSYADFPIAAPLSGFMQGIRALSMFIRLENHHHGVKVFNFTSSAEGEGKSALVMATARQLALEGQKVLVVDCDVRQPTLTNTFGIMQKPGLNEILKGQAALNSVLFRDTKTGAMILGVGKLEDVNVMSLSLSEWETVLTNLSSEYDIVLLDSPPIASFPESRLLAKLSRNILCVRWNKTSVKRIHFALDALERLECPVLGTVITMSESKQNFVQDSYRS